MLIFFIYISKFIYYMFIIFINYNYLYIICYSFIYIVSNIYSVVFIIVILLIFNIFFIDYSFDVNTRNSKVFDSIIKSIVDATIDGFNGTIFFYGQFHSGKTYTVTGTSEDPGIIPLTAEYIFNAISNIIQCEFLLRFALKIIFRLYIFIYFYFIIYFIYSFLGYLI